jgi:hypothetical protein
MRPSTFYSCSASRQQLPTTHTIHRYEIIPLGWRCQSDLFSRVAGCRTAPPSGFTAGQAVRIEVLPPETKRVRFGLCMVKLCIVHNFTARHKTQRDAASSAQRRAPSTTHLGIMTEISSPLAQVLQDSKSVA